MRSFCLPGLGVRCAISDHALERYGERVRPHLAGDQDALAADMLRLVAVCGRCSPQRPDWVHKDWTKQEFTGVDLWVHCGDIALVAAESQGRCPYVVTTVLDKGGISEAARERRNDRRSGRTFRKRKAKQNSRDELRKVPPRRHVELPDPT